MCRVGGPRCTGHSLIRLHKAIEKLKYAQSALDNNPDNANCKREYESALRRLESAENNWRKTTGYENELKIERNKHLEILKQDNLSDDQRSWHENKVANLETEIQAVHDERLACRRQGDLTYRLSNPRDPEYVNGGKVPGTNGAAITVRTFQQYASAYNARAMGVDLGQDATGKTTDTALAGVNRYGQDLDEIEASGEKFYDDYYAQTAEYERISKQLSDGNISEREYVELKERQKFHKDAASDALRKARLCCGFAENYRAMQNGQLKQIAFQPEAALESAYSAGSPRIISDVRNTKDKVPGKLEVENKPSKIYCPKDSRNGDWQSCTRTRRNQQKVATVKGVLNQNGQVTDTKVSVGIVQRKNSQTGRQEYMVVIRTEGHVLGMTSNNDTGKIKPGEIEGLVGDKYRFSGTNKSQVFTSMDAASKFRTQIVDNLSTSPAKTVSIENPIDRYRAIENSFAGRVGYWSGRSISRRIASGKVTRPGSEVEINA